MRLKRLLERLPMWLEEGERVLHLGTSSNNTLVAATDRRLLVLSGRGSDANEIPYKRILSFTTAKRRRRPSLSIRAETGELVIDGGGESYDDMCRLVHTRMWEASVDRAAEPAAPAEPVRRAASA
jgi:Bacterial PH domain